MLSHDRMAQDLFSMRMLKIKIPDEEDIIPGCLRRYTWDSKKKIKKLVSVFTQWWHLFIDVRAEDR